MPDLVSLNAIRAAADTISGQVVRTPTVASPGLTALLGAPVIVKAEGLQRSGSFKPRGILNRIAAMSAEERARGLLTVSGGNHGLAVAEIAAELGIAATIIMPEAAPALSKARIRAAGARLILAPDSAAAFALAEERRRHGATYLHSFDDAAIIAGYGTVGLELIEDAPDLTDILVSIGGGGLIAGVAVAVRTINPEIRVWGVEPVGAETMTQALAAGAPVQVQVTSICTTLGPPSVSALSLAHVERLVESVLVVTDAEAVAGVLTIAEHAKLWVEPAAGCLIPAARRVLARVGPGARLGLVLCGGNAAFRDIETWAARFAVGR